MFYVVSLVVFRLVHRRQSQCVEESLLDPLSDAIFFNTARFLGIDSIYIGQRDRYRGPSVINGRIRSYTPAGGALFCRELVSKKPSELMTGPNKLAQVTRGQIAVAQYRTRRDAPLILPWQALGSLIQQWPSTKCLSLNISISRNLPVLTKFAYKPSRISAHPQSFLTLAFQVTSDQRSYISLQQLSLCGPFSRSRTTASLKLPSFVELPFLVTLKSFDGHYSRDMPADRSKAFLIAMKQAQCRSNRLSSNNIQWGASKPRGVRAPFTATPDFEEPEPVKRIRKAKMSPEAGSSHMATQNIEKAKPKKRTVKRKIASESGSNQDSSTHPIRVTKSKLKTTSEMA